MTTLLKPLRECIRAFRDRVATEYDAASTDSLFELIISCDSKLISEREDCDRVDALRTINWYINAALTRRGIPPSYRRGLGLVPSRSTRLLHDIKRQDAPYLDLQWLAYIYPESVPKRWTGVKSILSTAPGIKASVHSPGATIGITAFGVVDPDERLDYVFDAADRLIKRQVSKPRLCSTLKLSTAAQSEMRWLCSRTTRQLIRDLDAKCDELRHEMRLQKIKQLTPELIESRIHIFRAWKLAGGGTNWQAAADILQRMTGVRKTRQAIKDMITRLGSQKLIKLRRGKKKMLEPLLSE